MTVRRCWLVAVTLTTAALAGCGITTETHPRPVTPPSAFLQAATSPTPAPTASGPITEQLFLVKDDTLTPVIRHVDRQPTTDNLLNDLLAGPTDNERATGITSALQGGNVVASIHLNSGQAVVELASAMDNTARNDEVLAYAQLVCTLTGRPDVDGVTFTRNGQPIGVPRGDGSLAQGPLTAADYASLLTSPSPSPHPS